MSDNFDQQVAHRPAPPPSGSRQDGHSGGSATSRANLNPARRPLRTCAKADADLLWLAETSSFMLQM